MRIALVGYGRMGRELERVALETGHEIVARLDAGDSIEPATLAGAEVALEFTTPQAAPGNLASLAAAGVDVACGTTGWDDALPQVRAAVSATGRGLVHAPNFSVGVALFERIVRAAAAQAAWLPEYDVFVHETHHRAKLDHPSGTARHLADALVEALSHKHGWAEAPPTGAASAETLWVSVTRAGSVPGTHVVGLEGPDDRIVLRHEARNRRGFARGALEAAAWIRGRPGVFSLDAFLTDRFGLRPAG